MAKRAVDSGQGRTLRRGGFDGMATRQAGTGHGVAVEAGCRRQEESR